MIKPTPLVTNGRNHNDTYLLCCCADGWMIPENREHSHSGTVTVEKQQQLQICKIEAALNYIFDELTPTKIILTKKNWLSYKWCRKLVEKVTARNKYTVSLLLQMFQT